MSEDANADVLHGHDVRDDASVDLANVEPSLKVVEAARSGPLNVLLPARPFVAQKRAYLVGVVGVGAEDGADLHPRPVLQRCLADDVVHF